MNRRLIIEPLLSVEEYLPFITESERRMTDRYGDQRRCESFAWRAVVRRELGDVAIGYNAVGAPVLPDHPDLHISVSHGADRVAVCISDRPCVVDVESLGRNFERIAPRYLLPEEAVLGSDPCFAAAVWCAKECLYKLSGERELDLLADLRITATGTDWIEGCIKKGSPMRFSLRYFDDAVVVWSL